MAGEVQLFSDDDGLAVIGDPDDVTMFLHSHDLSPVDSSPFSVPVGVNLGQGLQAVSEIARNSGQWVKLTKESAKAVSKFGLRQNGTTGLATGVIKGTDGQIRGFVEFVRAPTSVGATLLNPAALASIGALMQQHAMQQAMAEIQEYLERIDAKVDDVLQAQTDAAVAPVIGVGCTIDAAMKMRDVTGRMDEITWSRVQGCGVTIATAQAYALRQLDGLVNKVTDKTDLDDIVTAAVSAGPKVRDWLTILARCSQLHDALDVVELDRVLDASPDDLESHRAGLRAARQQRIEQMLQSTNQLWTRLETAAHKANSQVLLHPHSARRAVETFASAQADIVQFQNVFDTQHGHTPLSAKLWTTAVVEARDKALDVGSHGLDAGRNGVVHVVNAFRSVDCDGDGLSDPPAALVAVQNARSTVADAVANAGTAVKTAAADAVASRTTPSDTVAPLAPGTEPAQPPTEQR